MLLKFKSVLTTGLVFILAILLTFSGFRLGASAQIRPVTIAPGYEFSLFADRLNIPEFDSGAFAGPTAIAFDSRGRLFVATFSGKILILIDNNEDGRADEVKTFAKSIPTPLGLEFHPNGDLYTTSNIPVGAGRILRLRDTNGDDVADETSVIVDGLPSEGDHQTDRLKFGPDGMLYFGQGSSTDNGTANPGRPVERQFNAAMLRINVNNPSIETIATGLRNPFGMAFHPENGALFSTDGGSGEHCQGGPNCPPEDLSPPEEVNWVVPGSNYGFPQCEGSPTTEPRCSGVRAPLIQYPAHLTPTSLCFYTGPQAGEFRNQLLLTLYKNLPNLQNYGGDLRRIVVDGNPQSGFTMRDDGFIAQFNPIDPFDGPLDTAIDPISGDIYVARFDPVEGHVIHHHIIYRIHRTGSDQLPFIGPTNPRSVAAGSGAVSIGVIGRHLTAGATVLADGQPLTTRQGATRFDLIADLPASMTSSQRTIKITVRNGDNSISNEQTFTVRNGSDPDPDPESPAISSFFVYKKKRNKPVNPVRAGIKGKKFKIVVTGENFDTNAELLVRGESVQIDSRTSTEIVARLTNPLTAAPGQLSIQVRNSDGTLSNTLTLTVVGATSATLDRVMIKDHPKLKGRR
jgi:glucose/arabinose dehydrogenase